MSSTQTHRYLRGGLALTGARLALSAIALSAIGMVGCSAPPPLADVVTEELVAAADVSTTKPTDLPRYDPSHPRSETEHAAQRLKLEKGEDFNALALLPGVAVASRHAADTARVSPDRLQLPLAGNEGLIHLEPGSVLTGGRSATAADGASGARNPFGFLRKVKAVTVEADTITIETARPKLAEVFAGAVHVTMSPAEAEPIDVTGVDLRQYFPNLEDYVPPGTTTARGRFEQARGDWGLDLDVHEEWGFDSHTWKVPPIVVSYTYQRWDALHLNVLWSVPISLTANIDFTSSAKLGVLLELGFDVNTPPAWWESSLEYAKVVAGGTLDVDTTTDFTLKLDVGASSTSMTSEMMSFMLDELAVQNPIPEGPMDAETIASLGPFTGPALGPVPTSFLIEFKAACEIGGSATLHARARAQLSAALKLGFEYTKADGIRFPFSSSLSKQVSFQFLDGGAAVNVACQVGPRLSWLIGDIGGPYIDGRGIAEGELSYQIGCAPPSTLAESGPRTGTLSAALDVGLGVYLGGMVLLEAADMTLWEYDFGAMELYKKMWTALERSWDVNEGGHCLSDCEDGKQNNQETGSDCGGETCKACPAGSGCITKLDCGMGLVCKASKCLPEDPSHPGDPTSVVDTCKNGKKDNDEWDADCGPMCGLCKLGQKCSSLDQCASGACVSGTCAGWDCSNKHWESCCETDVDCGGNCKIGGAVKRCNDGQRCVWDDDCASNACRSLKLSYAGAEPISVCVPKACDWYDPSNPTYCGGQCTYETWQGELLAKLGLCKNGLCGYSFNKCKKAQPCQVGRDCLSAYCDPSKGTCQTAPCQNKVKDDGEMGVDCGGNCVPFCEDKFGAPIPWAGFEPRFCMNHTCPAETPCQKDTDCTFLPAPTWQFDPYLTTCSAWNGTGFGATKTCKRLEGNGIYDGYVYDHTSWDTVQKGPVYSETDIDCGGTSGRACPALALCERDADCDPGLECRPALWDNFRCLPVTDTCDDGHAAGDEADVDCGGVCGGYPGGCRAGKTCTRDADCWSGQCDGFAKTCAYGPHGYECAGVLGTCRDMCDNGVKNEAEGEADVDCAGPHCASKCGNDRKCKTHDDCESHACNPTLGVCRTSTCDDGFAGGTEPDADCGGECNALGWPLGRSCPGGKRCYQGSDCWSGDCADGQCVPSTWENGVLDAGIEADVDCGDYAPTVCSYGKACDLRCADGKTCVFSLECQSGMCKDDFTCGWDFCRDGVKDKLETDTDCGGPECKTKCGVKSGCQWHSDCQSHWCHEGTCFASFCDDGSLSAAEGETDVDCGGGWACVGNGKLCPIGKHCKGGTNCLSGICNAANACVGSTCEDKKRSPTETDVDCGGSCATKCALLAGCKTAGDCASGFCNGAVCVASACSDLQRSPGEADVDCGGVCPAKCSTGKRCATGVDCVSKLCSALGSCVTSSCDDGRQSGDETDVDCGGSCKTDCLAGARCLVAGDCASGVCGPGATCLTTCFNQKLDPGESDLDCGGACGPTCAVGAKCNGGGDCLSGACSAQGTCLASGCSDGKLSGSETDVDCGGTCPTRCGVGQICALDGDCQSKACSTALLCVASLCADGKRDGAEMGIDCGGDCPTGCAAGAPCQSDTDCASSVCAVKDGLCVTSTCQNQKKDANEAGLDCGAACPLGCGLGTSCQAGADCASSVCSAAGSCVSSTCEDGVTTGDESGLDCGGPCATRCAVGQGCLTGGDCASSWCGTNHRCVASHCDDGATSPGEADVDCGGACAAACALGLTCAQNTDCASGVCSEALRCVASACENGRKDASENGVDCGGVCGAGCGLGTLCQTDAGCLSGACAAVDHVCVASMCGNQAVDAGEADVDCGGACPTPCAAGARCAVAADCGSAICSIAGQCVPSLCEDGRPSGDETATDCGGSCPTPCAFGLNCERDVDCATASCASEGTCVCPASTYWNASTAVCGNCACSPTNALSAMCDAAGQCPCRPGWGGRTCDVTSDVCLADALDCDDADACTADRCDSLMGCLHDATTADGRACDDAAPCTLTSACLAGRCVSATAVTCPDDGNQCSAESCEPSTGLCRTAPVDCDDANLCTDDSCTPATGCLHVNNTLPCGPGSACSGGLCEMLACENGVKDDPESDVDCGGSCAKRCLAGQGCGVEVDCDSGACSTAGVCVTSHCADGKRSGDETDADCGGSCLAKCTTGRSCVVDGDCATTFCNAASGCVGSYCDDGRLSGDETDVDCGGSCSADCALGASCSQGADCGSGICSAVSRRCAATACEDETKGPTESDVDCGGSCPTRCANGGACASGLDCSSNVCSVAHLCVATLCADGTRSGDESDVDCGGACPTHCAAGRTCGGGADCASGLCAATSHQCVTTTCADEVTNGGETDLDCGGACTTRCALGRGCSIGSDCASGVCSAAMTCVATTCADGRKDGTESDVDCGGTCPSRCAVGASCGSGADCGSSVCSTAYMCVSSTCLDGRKTGDETDVDCGGSCATTCALGSRCAVSADCTSAVCSAGLLCVASRCVDGKKDGSETDVDCGGVCTAKCALGAGCSVPTDCASTICSAWLACVASPCQDGRKGAGETGLDCGGSCPTACGLGDGCAGDADCLGGICSAAGACVGSHCEDGKRSGGEAGIDCGGTCAATCPDGSACGADRDCTSAHCAATSLVCVASACHDERRDGDESDIDCGGACATTCAIGAGCATPTDCTSNACSTTLVCVGSTCEDGRLSADESDVDCGGACTTDCAFGQRCLAGADCVTALCSAAGTCACADTRYWNTNLLVCDACACAPGTSLGPSCDSGGRCACSPGWGGLRCDVKTNACLADGLVCADQDPCTLDTCDAVVGCVFDPVGADGLGCDDQNPCTVETVCHASQCGGGTAVVCPDDGDLCTVEACSPLDGLCAATPESCDDANNCTEDTCDPAVGCGHSNLAGACEYGCTNGTNCLTGQCKSGQCVGGCSLPGLPGAPDLPLGIAPVALTTADFNGDGAKDLAVLGASGDFRVVLGVGDGTYLPAVTYPSQAASYVTKASVVAGDVNADANIDLVWTNRDSDTVSVLLGAGDGTFGPSPGSGFYSDFQTSWEGGWAPIGAALADVTGDGHMDIVVANGADGAYVSILSGNGTGYFTLTDWPNFGGVLTSLAVGRLNADAAPDLAITRGNGYLDSVQLVMNAGGGFYGADFRFTLGAQPFSSGVAIADLNGDGKGDVAVSNVIVSNVAVILGNGTSFASPVYYPTAAYAQSVAAVDLTGDGKLDLVARSSSASGYYVSTLTNNGNGTFKPKVDMPGNMNGLAAIAVGDQNGDGAVDLVMPDVAGTGVVPWLNSGTGTLLVRTNLAAGAAPSSVSAAQLNADAQLDLVVANKTANTVSVLLGSGGGAFSAAVAYATGTSPSSVVACDLTGDQRSDLLVANRDADSLSVLVNNGDGTFKSKVDYATGDGPIASACADVTGDGKLDLIVVNNLDHTVRVLAGTGTGTLSGGVDYGAGWAPTAVALGDWNADTHPDLALTNDGGVSVLLGTGAGSFGAKVDLTMATVPAGIGAGDFNGDGRVDLVVSVPYGNQSHVTLFVNEGGGAFVEGASRGTGDGAGALTVGDFNADHRLDVVVVDGSLARLALLTGNGDGSLAPARAYETQSGSRSVVGADVTGDGKLDVVVGNGAWSTVSVLLNRCLDKP